MKHFLATAALLAFVQATSADDYGAGQCSLIPDSKTCIDSTPCKTDSSGVSVCLAGVQVPTGGVSLPQTCWQYSYKFSCIDEGAVDTCTQYATNASCGIVNSACQSTISESGACNSWTYTYRCETQAAQTKPTLSCASNMFSTAQFTTPSNPNANFGLSAVAMEALHEASAYTKDGNNLFAGNPENCTKGYWGLKNCCSSAPGGQSNSQVGSTATANALSVAKYAGEKVIDYASPYAYDALYSGYMAGLYSGQLMEEMASAINLTYVEGAAGSITENVATNYSANGVTLGAYGFTYSTGAFSSGFMGGNTMLASFGESGYIAFNPYVFVAMVVMQLVMDMISCTPEEQLLSMHKGANLSVFIKEECTSKTLGSCTLYTDYYCSFNTVLAKIINIQGKQQLGLDTTDCKGITPAQLTSLDFTKIDFSEFIATATGFGTSNSPSSSSMNTNYTPVMQGQNNGTTQTPTNVVTPTYPPKPN